MTISFCLNRQMLVVIRFSRNTNYFGLHLFTRHVPLLTSNQRRQSNDKTKLLTSFRNRTRTDYHSCVQPYRHDMTYSVLKVPLNPNQPTNHHVYSIHNSSNYCHYKTRMLLTAVNSSTDARPCSVLAASK